MIKERAMELVAALRSGKYQQTRYALKTKDGYCCLGVACEIAGANWHTTADGVSSVNGNIAVLPSKIQDYFGFWSKAGLRRDGMPLVIDEKGFDTLTDANDEGCTFVQIADYIEQNWEAL